MRLIFAVLAATALAACAPKPAGPDAETTAKLDQLQAELATAKPAAEARLALQAPPAEGVKAVYFANLSDGDTVTSPFRVVFGLSGMGVAPAGVEKENTGHHHLLIDAELSAEEMEFAIPNDEHHKHFGGGQTETVVTLPPGAHTLQLIVGDKDHTPLKPQVMSPKITITVK